MEALVHTDSALFASVLRMHLANDAVLFWNRTREFKIMVRNDPVDSETLSFQVCLVASGDTDDDDDGPLRKVLECECDGYYDEDGMFVAEDCQVALSEAARHPDALREARTKINAVWNYAVCPCGAYFVKDGAARCLYCQLTDDGSQEHTCAICLESSIEKYMMRVPCCQQLLHKKCLERWQARQTERCPLCRAHMP